MYIHTNMHRYSVGRSEAAVRRDRKKQDVGWGLRVTSCVLASGSHCNLRYSSVAALLQLCCRKIERDTSVYFRSYDTHGLKEEVE